MTLPEQDGIACVWDILAPFLYSRKKQRCVDPSLFTSMLLTMSNLLANSESSSFRTISKKSKCLECQTTTRIVYLVYLDFILMLSLCPEDTKHNKYTSTMLYISANRALYAVLKNPN